MLTPQAHYIIRKFEKIWPKVKNHRLAPDWVKKELSVEFELICDRLHRLECEELYQIDRSHYGNLLERIDHEAYWKTYTELIITIREYVTNPSCALVTKMCGIDYSLREWRKRSPSYE